MKSANDLQKLYTKWRNIDNLYEGDKSDWKEIYSKLWALELQLIELVIRKDNNMLFCDYIRRKILEDVQYEKNRVGAKF